MAKKAIDDAKATNISPQDIQQCARELNDIEDKMETLKGQVRSLRKKWKGDGIPLKAVDQVRSDKRKDLADVIQEQKDYQMVAAALSLDLTGAYQATFDFDISTEIKEENAKYDAGRDGLNFGRRGDPRTDNPFEAGTVAYAAWDAGWIDGEKEHFDGDAPPKKAMRKARKGAGAEMGPQTVQ